MKEKILKKRKKELNKILNDIKSSDGITLDKRHDRPVYDQSDFDKIKLKKNKK